MNTNDESLPDKNSPWWQSLIRCNPFYLASALMLVYGLYRLAVDPAFLGADLSQLLFSFGSIHAYCAMLVATAIILARRKIWYDSALLVFLEHFLVLIPFVLVGNAVFLGNGVAWILCATSTLLAGMSYGSFKRFIPSLNLPRELLIAGAFVLGVNFAMPLVFRHGLETANEIWAERSLYCWYLWLPLLMLLGNIIPTPHHRPAAEEHEKSWIPIATHLAWIAGTATHLYTIGYVDEQTFSFAQLSVLGWAASWFLCAKATPLLIPKAQRHWTLVLPVALAVPILSLGEPSIFGAVCTMNALILGVISWRGSEMKLAIRLATASLALAFLAFPAPWLKQLAPGIGKTHLIIAGVMLALVTWSVRTHSPRAGIVGSIALFGLVFGLASDWSLAPHLALQLALVFYLLHSLAWKVEEPGAQFSLLLAMGLWAMDAFYLDRSTAKFAGAIAPAASSLFLASALGAQILFRKQIELFVLGSLTVLLISPVADLSLFIVKAPAGLLSLVASFGLFAAGTAVALFRHRPIKCERK